MDLNHPCWRRPTLGCGSFLFLRSLRHSFTQAATAPGHVAWCGDAAVGATASFGACVGVCLQCMPHTRTHTPNKEAAPLLLRATSHTTHPPRALKAYAYIVYVLGKAPVLQLDPCVEGGQDLIHDVLVNSPQLPIFQGHEELQQQLVDPKCAVNNELPRQKWKAVRQQQSSTQQNPRQSPATEFVRLFVGNLRPEHRERMARFMAGAFFTRNDAAAVIGVHHRHGNGEVVDFAQSAAIPASAGAGTRSGGVVGARMNADDELVAQWLHASVRDIAAAHGLPSYKVFLATDSPSFARRFQRLDPSVVIFDEVEKERMEGHGFVMPGVTAQVSATNLTEEARASLCKDEATRSLLDMLLLGFTDVLVASKRSSFTAVPRIMGVYRGVPVCSLVTELAGEPGGGEAVREVSFTCSRLLRPGRDGNGTDEPGEAWETKRGIARTRKDSAGLAQDTRRWRRGR